MGWHARRLIPAFLGLMVSTACAEPTQLLVEVHSDLNATSGLLLTVDARAANQGSALREIALQDRSFPVSFGLTAEDGPLTDGLDLNLELRNDSGVLAVSNRRISAWSQTGKRFVQICLSPGCDNATCAEGTSCGNAGCVAQLVSSTDQLDSNFECGPAVGTTDAGTTDAGTTDAEPTDAEPLDGEADSGRDAGLLLDGSQPDRGPDTGPSDANSPDMEITDIDRGDAGVPTDWWSTGSANRQRLVLTNPGTSTIASGTVVRVAFDHRALVQSGLSQSNGQDVLLFHNGTSYPRSDGLDEASFNATSGSTHLYFRLRQPLAPNVPDSDYQIYFGGMPAASPTNDSTPSFRVLTAQRSNVMLTQTTPTDLVTLTLSRARTNERWIVVAMWKLLRNPGDPVSSARFGLFEGPNPLADAQDLTLAQSEGGSHWSGTVIWYNGRNSGGPVMRLRGQLPPSGPPVVIDQVRLVAFLLPRPPAATDIAEANGLTTVTNTRVNLAPLAADSVDRMWFARGAHNRRPSTVVSALDVRANGNFTAAGSRDRFTQNLESFLTVVHFDRLRAGSTTSFRHVADAMGSRHKGLGQLAVPIDWFASADFDGIDPPTDFGGTAQTYLSLVEDVFNEDRDWVVLASARTGGSLDGEIRGELTVKSAATMVASSQVVTPNGWTAHSFVWADAGTGARRPAIEVTGQQTGVQPFQAQHGSLVGLSYLDPTAVFASVETHP